MSRYDGLIIPRSYNEYINKTDAATLQQALQLSGVLSGAVAAGDNKAVKSSAVNDALANYKKQTITTLTNEDLNKITTNGYYAMFDIDSIINKPSGNNMYNNLLEVIEMGKNRGMQKFYSTNTQQAFIRFWYYSNSAYVFTAWKQTTN